MDATRDREKTEIGASALLLMIFVLGLAIGLLILGVVLLFLMIFVLMGLATGLPILGVILLFWFGVKVLVFWFAFGIALPNPFT